MTIIIVSGGIDLSPGSTVALTGVTCALALRAGWPPLAALAAGVIVGGLVGLVNGLGVPDRGLVVALNVVLLLTMLTFDSKLLRDRSRRMDIRLAGVYTNEAALVAEHIKKFWDPRMRKHIFAHLDAGGAGLDPYVHEALETLKQAQAAKA